MSVFQVISALNFAFYSSRVPEEYTPSKAA